MRKAHALATAMVIVGLGGMSAAQAKTIPLGTVDAGDTVNFGDTITRRQHSFEDFVNFHLSGPSSISASFKSFFNIIGSSFTVELEQKTHGSWMDIATGSPQSSTYPFALSLLKTGNYRWEVAGTTGRKPGFWSASMSVAAVPEADVWTMLLIGAGLVGYQLRRKQNTLNQPPIA
jgi:hypothetical protein